MKEREGRGAIQYYLEKERERERESGELASQQPASQAASQPARNEKETELKTSRFFECRMIARKDEWRIRGARQTVKSTF